MLDQERFVHVFDGVFVFVDGGGQAVDADRTAAELLDDGPQQVPVHFVNEEKSPGLKMGGMLNIVRHEVELHCPANDIPEAITFDLDGLKIGDSIHISHTKLPKNASPVITDRDFTVATIVGTAAAKEEEAEAETSEE